MNHNAWQYMLLSSYIKLSHHSRSLSFMEILPSLLYRGGSQGPTRDREICFNCAQSLQSCLTLCNSMDHDLPGSSVHGILQARILEWVAISFSSDKVSEVMKWVKWWSEWSEVSQSCRLFAAPWTVTQTIIQGGLPWWLSCKESPCQFRRPEFDPCVGKIPWRRAWQPTPKFLPGKSHGQRSLMGYSLWGSQKNWTRLSD